MLLDIHRCSVCPQLKQCLLCGTHKAIPHNVTAVERQRAARIIPLPSSIPLATIAAAITKRPQQRSGGLGRIAPVYWCVEPACVEEALLPISALHIQGWVLWGITVR